ncbi:MAG: transporter substrate-binding domain-containing protein [Candidatus Cloacimonetes bacterium]|nr:transporter substrate-binding domain-containing protein [Candidatus Cloacimonadota bacterium]
MKASFKIVLCLLVVLVLVFGITACGKKQAKVLRIGTNAEYPPFESKVGDSFVGVDMDLARQIANKLDMEFEIIDMDFDTLIPSLNSKKIDFALSAISITDERKAQVDFSQPYYVVNQVIIAASDSKKTLAKIEDLGKFKVGALSSTTGHKYLAENYVDKGLMPKDNLRVYLTNVEAITDLLNAKIDFVIIDDSAAQGYAQQKPISIINKIETNENYGIAMPKGAELNDKINQALKELMDSGEVISIIQTHIQ